MHTKFERLLSKSLTTLEVMTYYLAVHTGPELFSVMKWPEGARAFGMVDYVREMTAKKSCQYEEYGSFEHLYFRDGSAQTICTCCHTEIEVADQTFRLTQSQYTDTGPTSPSTDPITPGAWQGSYWSANF